MHCANFVKMPPCYPHAKNCGCNFKYKKVMHWQSSKYAVFLLDYMPGFWKSGSLPPIKDDIELILHYCLQWHNAFLTSYGYRLSMHCIFFIYASFRWVNWNIDITQSGQCRGGREFFQFPKDHRYCSKFDCYYQLSSKLRDWH